MGYEITTAQKTIKYSTTRSPTSKKDSPIKFKQIKLKLVSFDDIDKVNEDNIQDENGTETVEIEKNNESPTKISEAYTETMDIDEQIPDDSLESNNIIETGSCAKIDVVNELELAQEIETFTNPIISKDQRSLSSEDSDDVSPIDVGTEDTETQQDIFDGMSAKTNVTTNDQTSNNDQTNNNQTSNDQTSNDQTSNNQTSNIINTVIQNNSVDSIKLNVTDDSVIDALPNKDDNPINMEDTVDVQNITELNSTVNADEIFCEKPIRSSTQAVENVAEQDTLSVTDSIFDSLSSTQGVLNQETQNNAELDPEFFDSTHSIYPTLSSCMEPIDTIIKRLTYPLWKTNLTTYFANRDIHTIGDFARLSEREVDGIPVKGKPKTEFVKKILEQFESTYKLQTESSDNKSNEVEQLPTKAMDEESTISIAAISDVEIGSAISNNESLTCSTPLIRPAENMSNNLSKEDSTEDSDKTESITSDMDISLEPVVPDNPDLSDLDTLKKNEQTSAKIPITVEVSKPETSTNNVESVPIPSSSSEIMYVIFSYFINKIFAFYYMGYSKYKNYVSLSGTTSQEVLSLNASLDISKDPTVSSSAIDELLITHSSIGTSTDEVGSTTSTVQKSTKSVAAQMSLAELLDEIDLNQVMESAVRRCSPEAILLQYKVNSIFCVLVVPIVYQINGRLTFR